MKRTASLIGRSLILGGGFGASIGQFLGQYNENNWQLIGTMMIVGVVVGLISVLGISSVRSASGEQLILSDSESALSGGDLLGKKRAA